MSVKTRAGARLCASGSLGVRGAGRYSPPAVVPHDLTSTARPVLGRSRPAGLPAERIVIDREKGGRLSGEDRAHMSFSAESPSGGGYRFTVISLFQLLGLPPNGRPLGAARSRRKDISV